MSLQTVKDSFLNALSTRLGVLNPLRTVVIEGVVRPAAAALENELATKSVHDANTFYLNWKAAIQNKGASRLPQPLIELECQISYWTEGSDSLSYQDRGRSMAALDDELLSITLPANAQLQDFSANPPADLFATIFWSAPEFGELAEDGRKLQHTATLKVFYLLEVLS